MNWIDKCYFHVFLLLKKKNISGPNMAAAAIKEGKTFYYCMIVSVFCCCLFASSCKKVLDDVKNQSAVTLNDVWSDPNAIGLLVNNIYTIAVPDNFGNGYSGSTGYDFRYFEGNITDEGRPSSTFIGRANGVNNGVAFTVTASPFQIWPYDVIRQCNDFLEKINSLYPVKAGAPQSVIDQRNSFIGQVTFFRAYMYWRMVQIYGGVPIIDHVLQTNDPVLYAPRNTQEQCFQFIIKDLQTASNLLPATYVGNNLGRITKGAALALLSRVLLNRASPMYNKSNTQYWQDAAAAAKAVLDLPGYSLYSKFGRWFFDKDNPENIWQVSYVYPQKTHGWDAANHPLSWAIGDAVATCPTEELVEAFPMINGKAITDPTSGYNPNDPYTNRDPRLRATVIVNGDVFGANPQLKGDDGVLGHPVRIWSYLDGADGYDEGSNYRTSTGYHMRKAMDTTLLSAVPRIYGYGTGSSSDWVEIRLAEVMLNYAEAENELGNTAPAYTYISMIRQRAGIQPGNNYGIPAGLGTDAMRSFIQNERFIEFAFENKRYWDLKRWNLAATVLSRPTHTMRIKKITAAVPPNLTTAASNFTFDPTGVNVADRSFPPVFLQNFYFLPLPRGELLLNKNLIQNPGW
jgi:hypothetical protein